MLTSASPLLMRTAPSSSVYRHVRVVIKNQRTCSIRQYGSRITHKSGVCDPAEFHSSNVSYYPALIPRGLFASVVTSD